MKDERTSRSLVARLVAGGDDLAWTRFTTLYGPLLRHWVRRLGLDESTTADVVQETLVLLMQKLPEFEYDRSRSFRAWLRTVTTNQCRDHLRARQRDPGQLDTDQLRRVASGGDDVQLFTDDEYRTFLTRRALEVMQSNYGESTWRACWLTTVDGLPAAEVARQLGLTVNAVYLAKSRVLRDLREELSGLVE